MRLVEMKCKNCGANLEVDEDSEFVNCPYCDATYKLDDEVKHVKYDNMENSGYEFEKGRIKAQKERFGIDGANVVNSSKMIMIVIIFIFICIFSISIFSVTRHMIGNKSRNLESGNITKEVSRSELDSFNGKFEVYIGTSGKLFVDSILDNVVTNNKKEKDKIIKVTYKETSITEPDKIVELKRSLDSSKKYEISLNYDEVGFVNEVLIQE